MSLKNTIELMAGAFADELLRALRGASLDELLAASDVRSSASPRGAKAAAAAVTSATARRPRAGRWVRRSPQQIASVMASLVGALKGVKDGMTSEELQKAISVDKKTIVRPIAVALNANAIRKTGQKRATRYFAR